MAAKRPFSGLEVRHGEVAELHVLKDWFVVVVAAPHSACAYCQERIQDLT